MQIPIFQQAAKVFEQELLHVPPSYYVRPVTAANLLREDHIFSARQLLEQGYNQCLLMALNALVGSFLFRSLDKLLRFLRRAWTVDHKKLTVDFVLQKGIMVLANKGLPFLPYYIRSEDRLIWLGLRSEVKDDCDEVSDVLSNAAKFNAWLCTFGVQRLIVQVARAPVTATDCQQAAHMLAAKFCPIKECWLLRDNIESWYHTLTFHKIESDARRFSSDEFSKPANHNLFNTCSRVFRLEVFWMEETSARGKMPAQLKKFAKRVEADPNLNLVDALASKQGHN